MVRSSRWLVASLALLVLSTERVSAQVAAVPMAPAALWAGLEEVERLSYLRGYLDGAHMTQILVFDFITQPRTRTAYPRTVPDTTLPFDSALGAVTDVVAGMSGGRLQPIASLIRQLYSDPANACIRLGVMAFAAIRRMSGMNDQEFSAYLARLRTAARGC